MTKYGGLSRKTSNLCSELPVLNFGLDSILSYGFSGFLLSLQGTSRIVGEGRGGGKTGKLRKI